MPSRLVLIFFFYYHSGFSAAGKIKLQVKKCGMTWSASYQGEWKKVPHRWAHQYRQVWKKTNTEPFRYLILWICVWNEHKQKKRIKISMHFSSSCNIERKTWLWISAVLSLAWLWCKPAGNSFVICDGIKLSAEDHCNWALPLRLVQLGLLCSPVGAG